MNYLQAIDYLNRETTEGIKPDLSRIRFICQKLSNPQLIYPTIHISGTNGKTSTARIIGTILSCLGLRVGVFTSPHLVSYTERIAVAQENIGETDFARVLEELIPLFEETNRSSPEGKLTQFEALTAMAFLYFREMGVDVAVIEVGMGGGWDATNTVMPRVAVVTNVSLEHTDRLGKTVEDIAKEKVGIIKPASSVVTGIDQSEILSIVKNKCQKEGATLKILGQDFDFSVERKGDRLLLLSKPKSSLSPFQALSIRGLFGNYNNLVLPLAGVHQAVNATLAITACELFLERGRHLEDLRMVLPLALKGAASPGRLELLMEKPMLVLDGAHNPASAKALGETLKEDFHYGKLILVLGILADKDVEGILSHLVPLALVVIATENQSDRALPAASLAGKVSRLTDRFIVERNLGRAIKIALGLADEADLVLVTGSLYTVGEAKELLSKG
ncbi:MAG: folylpolyglutamate synthase/dihydrofolate synthase family protein [Actinomycetota bacterium]